AASFQRELEGELARTAPADGQNQEGPERVPAQQRPDGARRQADREGSQDAAQAAAAQASSMQAAGAQAATDRAASIAAPVSGQLAPGSDGTPGLESSPASSLGAAGSLAAAAAAVATAATSATAAAAPPAGPSGGSAGADAPGAPDLSTVGSSPAGGLGDPPLPLAPDAPGGAATLPLATVGTQLKPSSPAVGRGDGEESGEGAGKGIAIAQSPPNQARPGIEVARPAGPHGEEVVAARQAGEPAASATPGIAVAHEPSAQGGGSAELGITVPGAVLKLPLDGLSGTGASPDAVTNANAAPAAEAPAVEVSSAP